MLRRLSYAFLACLLAFIVAMGWYVSSKGFTRKWRTFMVREFRKSGLEVNIRRLTLDPFRGLVAKDVRVLDANDRRRVLAWVDEILLGVNYASAVRGEPFLDSADLREASLWLPVSSSDRKSKIEIRKLNARLFLPPHQIYLASAQAEVKGVQVFATGRLVNPQAFHPGKAERDIVMQIGAQLLEELEKLHYGNTPPTLSLEFSGDLAHPEGVQADLRFAAREMKRKNYEFKTVGMAASYRKGIIELQQLHAVDARGELRASGTYDLESNAVALRAHSTLHLDEIERVFRWFPHLEEWSFPEPPKLDVNLAGALFPLSDLRVTGHADLRHAAFRRIPVKEFSADFSWAMDGWSLRDVKGRHAAGEFSGDATCRPGEFRAQLSSTVNPAVLTALLKPEHAEWLARFDFSNPPKLQLDVKGTEPALEECTGRGQLTYAHSLYQGQAITPASSTLEFAKGVLTLAPFTLEHEAANGPSRLLFDFARHEVRLEKAAPVPAPTAPAPE